MKGLRGQKSEVRSQKSEVGGRREGGLSDSQTGSGEGR
jgi:hypothetical protein